MCGRRLSSSDARGLKPRRKGRASDCGPPSGRTLTSGRRNRTRSPSPRPSRGGTLLSAGTREAVRDQRRHARGLGGRPRLSAAPPRRSPPRPLPGDSDGGRRARRLEDVGEPPERTASAVRSGARRKWRIITRARSFSARRPFGSSPGGMKPRRRGAEVLASEGGAGPGVENRPWRVGRSRRRRSCRGSGFG